MGDSNANSTENGIDYWDTELKTPRKNETRPHHIEDWTMECKNSNAELDTVKLHEAMQKLIWN